MDPEVISANNDAAVWLAKGFTPGSGSGWCGRHIGLQEHRPYPASKAMAVMHTALGDGLSAYMTGDKDADTALADIEAAYLTDGERSRFG